MDYRRKTSRNDDLSFDHPTYSRLFIVGDKKLTEDEMRSAFDKFGTIEDLRMPRDHNTGQPKGITFIKFSKTSEAAYALEAMDRKRLPNTNRPLKVMVAVNRSEIQSEETSSDDDKYKRLFITVPRTATTDEIKDYFSIYGCVENVRLQLDRNTGECKGFAYVKFRKFSEAACAFEECEQSYRAIFALPKGYNRRPETTFESTINSLATTSTPRDPLLAAMKTQPEGYTRVNFMCSPYVTQRHIARLFNIVPGMLHCHHFVDYMRNCSKGTVTYANAISAAYAVEKLHNLEYPPGMPIFVKPDSYNFDTQEQNYNSIPNVVKNLKTAIASSANSSSPDLAQLAEAIAEASRLIKMATSGGTGDAPDHNDLNYCSVKLPEQQPLADIDSPVAKRCFLVCKPQPPPLTVLRDVFCRFGNLINVYTLPGKTVGYARYASTESADKAISVLHGAEICGVRMKVLEADDEAPPKKARYNN